MLYYFSTIFKSFFYVSDFVSAIFRKYDLRILKKHTDFMKFFIVCFGKKNDEPYRKIMEKIRLHKKLDVFIKNKYSISCW